MQSRALLLRLRLDTRALVLVPRRPLGAAVTPAARARARRQRALRDAGDVAGQAVARRPPRRDDAGTGPRGANCGAEF